MIFKLILITTIYLLLFAACTQETSTSSPQLVDSVNSSSPTTSITEVTSTTIPVPTNTAVPKPVSTPALMSTNTAIPEPTTTPVPVPTSTAIPEPITTPAPVPTNTTMPKLISTPAANISPDLEFLTLQNKDKGISMEVPSSWNREQGPQGLHVRGKHGDFFIRHTQFGAHELTEAAEQIIKKDKNFSEEEREDTGFSIVSRGYYGRAYRELVFMVNSQSKITMFTFSTNPDFLDEYTPVFEIIKSSIQFTETMSGRIEKEPTVQLVTSTPQSLPYTPTATSTPTTTPTPTPTPTITQNVISSTPTTTPSVSSLSETFEPIPQEEMTETLTHILWTELPVVRTEPGSDFTGIGTDSLSIDQRQEVRDIFETGYYLLTGSSIPAKFAYELNTISDYKIYDPSGKSLGFCCYESANQLLMPINAENKFSKVLGTMAHEAGHGRHRILNNEPFGFQGVDGTQEGKTVKEAVAMAFGAAIVRTIGDYTDIEARNKPAKYRTVTIFNSLWQRWVADIDNIDKPHSRGMVLLWISSLKDPNLSDIKLEIEKGNHLSTESLLKLADYLGNMTQREANEYAAKYLITENLDELKTFIQREITSRTTSDDSEGLLDSNWEPWLVP